MKVKRGRLVGLLLILALVLGLAPGGLSRAYAAEAGAGTGGANAQSPVLQTQAEDSQSYFVQFRHGNEQYRMQGDNTVLLSEILGPLKLSGKVTKVEFDTPGLSAQEEGDTWLVTSDQKFDGDKSMYVTINGNRQQIYVNAEIFDIKAKSNDDIWQRGVITIFFPGGSQSFTMNSGISNPPLEWVITDYNWYQVRPWEAKIESDGLMTARGLGRFGMHGYYYLNFNRSQGLSAPNNAWLLDRTTNGWCFYQWRLKDPTYTPKNNFKIAYDGQSHALVKATGASGPRHYRYKQADATDWSAWSTEVPTASEAGTYQVQWYSEIGYEWLSKGSAESPAGEATATITTSVAVAPSLTGYPYYYDGNEHGVTATGASGGTVYYRTSTDNEDWTVWREWTDWSSTSVGKRTNAGVTYVQAYTKGDNDHADSGVVTEEVNIQKADPHATYQEPLSATYGQTLADVHLTSTGNVPGKWAWRDADTTSVGNAGEHNPEATFTPEDTTNYNTVGTSVRLTVYKANNLASVADEAYVTKGGNTVDLADNVWLNGAAGAVSYAIDGEANGCTLDGSVLKSGDTEGTVKVTVTVAGDDNHNELVAPVSVTVTGKDRQTIAADDVDVTYGDTDRHVVARVTNPAESGGAISYSVKAGSEKYIAVNATSGKLTIMEVPADGKAYVTATAEGTADYVRTTKHVTVNIAKADTVAATVTANDRTSDGTEQPLVTVEDLALVKGTMLYALGANSATAPEAAAFSTNIPTATYAGTYYVWYKVAGDVNHNDTTPACVTVNVAQGQDLDPNALTYTIASADEWNKFAELVNNGNTFTGVMVKLTNDITVETMAGTSANKFKGAFDGDGHTITFDCNAKEEYVAPFRYVEGASFCNLKVTGTIGTSSKYAGGFVGRADGNTTFQSCHSSIAISSSVNGDGTHGGFLAITGGSPTFTDCLFDGSISGESTTNCGGFVGWPGENNVTFQNCMNAGEFTTNASGCGTFSRGSKVATSNCYYKTAYGTEQGEQTNETGETLRSKLGDGWMVSEGDKVIPKSMPVGQISGEGTVESPYLITSEADWNAFALLVNGGNSFKDKIFRLTNDISVTTMVGTNDRRFKGGFDGDGKTLTFTCTTDAEKTAPFRYTDGAKFYGLTVNGSITTSKKFAAGFVAHSNGNALFVSCRSSIAITSTVDGDGTHGGFVAESGGSRVSFTDCLFDGSITGEATTNCGGFVGWPGSNMVSLKNCLNEGTFATKKTNDVFDGCGTFSRYQNSSNVVTINSYYRTAYGTEQGALTNETGAALRNLLGDGWVVANSISEGKVVPNIVGLTDETSSEDYEIVSFSGIDWIVLDASHSNGYATQEDLEAGGWTSRGVLLLAKSNIEQDASSDTKVWCTNFYDKVIKETAKSAILGVKTKDGIVDGTGEGAGDKVFALSAEEYAKYNGSNASSKLIPQIGKNWWLRSTTNNNHDYVNNSGLVSQEADGSKVNSMRPAVNLDFDKIICFENPDYDQGGSKPKWIIKSFEEAVADAKDDLQAAMHDAEAARDYVAKGYTNESKQAVTDAVAEGQACVNTNFAVTNLEETTAALEKIAQRKAAIEKAVSGLTVADYQVPGTEYTIRAGNEIYAKGIDVSKPTVSGTYDGYPMFRVLKVEDGKMLLMSEYLWAGGIGASGMGKVSFGNSGNAWQDSAARQWSAAFNEDILSQIQALEVSNVPRNVSDKEYTPDSSQLFGGPFSYGASNNILTTSDTVFFLSGEEALEFMKQPSERIAKLYDEYGVGDASYWWLRSAIKDSPEAGFMFADGSASKNTVTKGGYVRPVFWATIPEVEPLMFSGSRQDVNGTSRIVYTINCHTHAWGDPTYEWSADNGSVTAKRVCADDPTHVDTEIVNTIAEVTKQPTCTTRGETTYTTAAFKNPIFAEQKKTVEDLDALGHDWSKFTADGSFEKQSTITASCSRCGETGPSLTIVAPTLQTYGNDGSAEATIIDEGGIQGDATVRYYATVDGGNRTGEPLAGAPTGAGKWWAEITLGTGDNAATAHLIYDIYKAFPTYDSPAPTAVYGQTLADVELINPEGNTPGTWTWVDPETTYVGNTGQNTFKATFTPEDTANYLIMAGRDVTVTVGKAEVAIPEIAPKEYNAGPQSANIAQSDLYTVTKNDGGTNVGEYDVELTLNETDNHKWAGTEETNVALKFQIVAAKAPEVVPPNLSTVTYDPTKTLANVTMPEGWTWADNTIVPTVGNTGYAAKLMVDDQNYDYTGVFGYDAESHTVTRTVVPTVEKAVVPDPVIAHKFVSESQQPQVADVPESTLYSVTTNEGGTAIGDYTVVLTLTDPTNYKWTDTDEAAKTFTFSIVEGNENIVTVSIEGWTYGEQPKAPVATATYGANTATFSYSGFIDGPFSPEVPTNAGTWYVKASIEAGSDSGTNYKAGEATASFEIAKAASVPARVMADVRTYDGTDQPLVTEDPSTLAGGTMTYALGGDAMTVPATDQFGESIPTGTDAGTYYVWCMVKADDNHNDFGPMCVAVTITKADAAVTAPKATNPTYSGKPQALVASGSVEGGRLLYSPDGQAWSENIPTGTNAGNYTVWYKVEPDANYNAYGPARVAATVTKAPSTVTKAPQATNPTYDGKSKALVTAGAAAGGTMQYSLDGRSFSTNIPSGTDAKAYDVWYRVVGDANHQGVTTQKVTSTIRKVPNPIAARAKTASQSATYNPASATSLAANVAVSGARGKVSFSNVSSNSTAKRFAVNGSTGAVTVPKGSPTGTFAVVVRATAAGDSGHEAASRDVSFKVTVKPATFTVSAPATQAWTGGAIKAKPAVKSGSRTLKEGADYTLAWRNNVNGGTATVTVTGRGNYAGTKSVNFRIVKPSVQYFVHRQTYGNEKAWSKANGQTSGTVGEAKRLEAIWIRLANMPTSGSIQYRTHVQTYGWETGWRLDGATSGTTGQAKRLEAIQIKLTGEMAKKYDVYYRVHAQTYGWMGWAKNGASSGTAKQAKRLEAIQIVLVPKGGKAPGTTAGAFRQG